MCLRSLCALLLLIATTPVVTAQDFRIYTRVRDAAPGTSSQSTELARSLTLFHAGKVYDYIDEAQEVTIYEPARRRFLILNEPRRLATEITHDEIRRYIGLAEDQAMSVVRQSGRVPSPVDLRAADLIQFQLQPNFEKSFPAADQVLLNAPQMSYRAKTCHSDQTEVVSRYLTYADWAAQLNCVLHPRSLLPRPRLALNDELRTLGVLPQTVELTLKSDQALTRRAEHEFMWRLSDLDREMIHQWEKRLADTESIRRVPFMQFQQQLLAIRK